MHSQSWKLDTCFSDNGCIQLIENEGIFQIEVNLYGYANELPYLIDSSWISGLIPSFFHADDSIVFFIRGFGFHYRELIACQLFKDSVHINQFETELPLNADSCFFAYQDLGEPEIIQIIDCQKPLHRSKIHIPEDIIGERLIILSIDSSLLEFRFENHQSFSIKVE